MLLCVEPRNDGEQRLLDFAVRTDPAASLSREVDTFGNARHVLSINHPHETLEITSRSTVEAQLTHDIPDTAGAGAWEEIHAGRDAFAEWDYTQPSPLDSRIDGARRSSSSAIELFPSDDPLESLLQLSDLLFRSLSYVPGATSAESVGRPDPAQRPRSLPGLCARHDRRRPILGNSVEVRLRLPPRFGQIRSIRRPTMPHTPGWSAGCRISAGSASTRPTRASRPKPTSASRRVGTTGTSLRPVASFRGVGSHGSRWMCASAPIMTTRVPQRPGGRNRQIIVARSNRSVNPSFPTRSLNRINELPEDDHACGGRRSGQRRCP